MEKFKRFTALVLVLCTVLTSGCGNSIMNGLYADELSTEIETNIIKERILQDGREDTNHLIRYTREGFYRTIICYCFVIHHINNSI